MTSDKNLDEPIDRCVAKDQPGKLSYTSPVLTRYGQMSALTKLGGGPGPNDGDNLYGRPVS